MPIKDKTIERNYLSQMKNLVSEYELVKSKKHPRFRFVTDFYKASGIKRQNFIKYYNRFKINQSESSLLPQKRGRKFGNMQYQKHVRDKIAELRAQGFGRYEILDLMLPSYGDLTPSASTIYNILKEKGLNKLDPRMIQTKKQIIKDKAGELGHMDCHRLAKGIISGTKPGDMNHELFLLSLVDDYSRMAFCIVIDDLTSLTVSMATLKLLSVFHQVYHFQFQEILTDNGSEFGRRDTKPENKRNHPFERILQEKNITHRYTKPYRPQTNGKVERYWRTIEDDLLRDEVFDSRNHLEEQLLNYITYYNHMRRHQGIKNITPYEQLMKLSVK